MKDYRRRNLKGVVVKLDLEKAYDKADWNFLDFILARKDFEPNGHHGSLVGFHLPIFFIILHGVLVAC